MEKIRISAVRYANTYPFMYGLTECGFEIKSDLRTDHPSDCASRLISGDADLGLIPVSAIPRIKGANIISEYCIGAFGRVRSVQMMSNTSFDRIETIYLDYRSMTSVNLIRVLAERHWRRKFAWTSTDPGFDFASIEHGEAVVLIGDQCFALENNYEYKWDLAFEWKRFTGLPFVFACWVANKTLPQEFILDFNKALSFGVNNIESAAAKYGKSGSITGDDLVRYLKLNIDFFLNENKKLAIDLFLKLSEDLK